MYMLFFLCKLVFGHGFCSHGPGAGRPKEEGIGILHEGSHMCSRRKRETRGFICFAWAGIFLEESWMETLYCLSMQAFTLYTNLVKDPIHTQKYDEMKNKVWWVFFFVISKISKSKKIFLVFILLAIGCKFCHRILQLRECDQRTDVYLCFCSTLNEVLLRNLYRPGMVHSFNMWFIRYFQTFWLRMAFWLVWLNHDQFRCCHCCGMNYVGVMSHLC